MPLHDGADLPAEDLRDRRVNRIPEVLLTVVEDIAEEVHILRETVHVQGERLPVEGGITVADGHRPEGDDLSC